MSGFLPKIALFKLTWKLLKKQITPGPMYLKVVLLPGQCFRMLWYYDSFLLAPGVSNGKNRRNLMRKIGHPHPLVATSVATSTRARPLRKSARASSLSWDQKKGPENPPSMASKTGLSLAEAEMESKNGYGHVHTKQIYIILIQVRMVRFFEWATRLKSKLSQRLRRRVSHDC